MAQTSRIKGIILKITDTPGKDKLLHVLTEQGIVRAFMTPKKNAGKKSYTVDLFSYCEIVIFTTDGGNNLVNSVVPEEYFYKIREDIARLYAAGYFASLALYTAQDAETDTSSLMELVYESFMKLSDGVPVNDIKPVFEFVVARLLGITPCLEAEQKSTAYYFSIDDGRLYLSHVPNSVYVTRKVVMSVYKVINSTVKQALEVKSEDVESFYKLAEQYILYHTDHNFENLKYLNGVI